MLRGIVRTAGHIYIDGFTVMYLADGLLFVCLCAFVRLLRRKIIPNVKAGRKTAAKDMVPLGSAVEAAHVENGPFFHACPNPPPYGRR